MNAPGHMRLSLMRPPGAVMRSQGARHAKDGCKDENDAALGYVLHERDGRGCRDAQTHTSYASRGARLEQLGELGLHLRATHALAALGHDVARAEAGVEHAADRRLQARRHLRLVQAVP